MWEQRKITLKQLVDRQGVTGEDDWSLIAEWLEQNNGGNYNSKEQVKKVMYEEGFLFVGETNQGKILHFYKPIYEEMILKTATLEEIAVYKCFARINEDESVNYKFECNLGDDFYLSSEWFGESTFSRENFKRICKNFLEKIPSSFCF